MNKPKLLCLCDSPTIHTGFGRVAQALIERWKPHFERIDIHAINYDGDTPLPDSPWAGPKVRLLRARHPWYTTEHLQRFLNAILAGDYTHVWIMQDLFLLSPNGFPGAFRQVCQKKGVRSLLYYPVDGPLDPEWTDMLRAVDVPVAYTEFGAVSALKALHERLKNPPDEKVSHTLASAYDALRPADDWFRNFLGATHIPHGVDTRVFHTPQTDRNEVRAKLFGDWIKPTDFLMVNVNQNSRRKAVWASLVLLAEMKKTMGVSPARLLLHCPPVFDGIDLEAIGRQLGLNYGVDWAHTGNTWTKANIPQWTEEQIRDLYHAADLTLTTSLGEGWGLSITESLATGCPVAAPDHTSCREIWQILTGEIAGPELSPFGQDLGLDPAEYASGDDIFMLPLGEPVVVGESRVRSTIHASASATNIHHWRSSSPGHRVALSHTALAWLDWDRIASEWLAHFRV
jgi:glycosyltransferase involved in cell wall biosynthesis